MNLKAILFLAAVLTCSGTIFAQKTVDNQGVSVGLLSLEYFREMPISKRSTIQLHGGLQGELGYSRSTLTYNGNTIYDDDTWSSSLRVTVGADVRFYYNQEKRFRKGKNTHKNSGGYLGTTLQYYTPGLYKHNMDTNHVLALIPHWGFKRVYKHNWFLDFNTGLGLSRSGSDFGAGWSFNFKFGKTF